MQDIQTNRIDKYKAIWLSYSSVSDFKKCPRLYYFQNIYKNPKTNKKINISSPFKTLGISVHNVLESLNKIKTEDRSKQDLLSLFEKQWMINKDLAGFENIQEEQEFKNRGIQMLLNVSRDMKMLNNKTISLSSYYKGDLLPNIYLNEYENIILCGNIDWIEYNEKENNISVIDFKTGKREEMEDSIQLPIYKILLQSLQQKWEVKNGKYWYLESGKVIEKDITDQMISDIKTELINVGISIRDKKMSWDTQTSTWKFLKNIQENFICINGENCDCKKYDKILNGKAILLGTDIYNKEVYKVNSDK